MSLLDQVAVLLQEAADQVVNPRFQSLRASEVHEKTPGDLVTDADREAEVLITAGLRRLDPGAVVVGEEAVAADPALLALVATAPRVWVVDPVDGTNNFVAGSSEHAVMAALIVGGQTVLGCIWQPQLGHLWTAERGAGAFRDGDRLAMAPPPGPVSSLAGVLAASYLDPATRAEIERNRPRFAELRPGRRCAGVAYPRLACGQDDFALFWKVLPWDHAPGELFVTETGGDLRRLDGSAYRGGRPVTGGAAGLLVTRHADAWDDVRLSLLEP